MTNPPARHTVDTITSDALDQLHARIDWLEQALATVADCFNENASDLEAALRLFSRSRRARGSAILQARRWAARARTAEAALAELHAGEERPECEFANHTPAQWLWEWNHATPEQRLQAAEHAIEASAIASMCRLEGHISQLADARTDRATIARVRTLHRPVEDGGRTLCAECSAYDEQHGSTDNMPVTYDQCGTLAALDQQPA
ncbi:hypothetical protein [Streptomyces sp. NPDC093093]|uniref:hypothetical protein n=1 Tax=Streptomyces sp. NPDC093093 TaxID=3366025 RepID=UPI00380DA0AF